MSQLVLFGRVGWMLWYKGVQADDPKPIGGGLYNKEGLGHELFNFLPAGKKYLGFFQPQLQPKERRDANPSTIHLEKIEQSVLSDKLEHVLVIFVAKNPYEGGQHIVGWYRDATVYRHQQSSSMKARKQFGYFLETAVENAVLVPKSRRSFLVPSGKGGFGQANICYTLDGRGNVKHGTEWMTDAVDYVTSYKHENAISSPESASDQDIADVVEISIEGGAGYQSNPRIRRAIEDYAMEWAEKRLRLMGLIPRDRHKTESFDFLCTSGGTDLFVEVKGTQSNGKCISLTPNEVSHAKKFPNSALFIVYGVEVVGKRKPKVKGGSELLIMPWDIKVGKLEPRGYAFTVPNAAFQRVSAAKAQG